jgi:hypothetical protein
MKNENAYDIQIFRSDEPYVTYVGATKWEIYPDQLMVYPNEFSIHGYLFVSMSSYTIVQTHRKVEVVQHFWNREPSLSKSYEADVIYRVHEKNGEVVAVELIKNRFTDQRGLVFKTLEEFWNQVYEWGKL